MQRRQDECGTDDRRSLSDTETIAVLVELVRTPRSSARRIATILGTKGLHVRAESVQTIIDTYDLRKKGRYPR